MLKSVSVPGTNHYISNVDKVQGNGYNCQGWSWWGHEPSTFQSQVRCSYHFTTLLWIWNIFSTIIIVCSFNWNNLWVFCVIFSRFLEWFLLLCFKSSKKIKITFVYSYRHQLKFFLFLKFTWYRENMSKLKCIDAKTWQIQCI